MSERVYTIPNYDALPADACGWPGCAQPVCQRNEDGSCPLSDDIVVDCSNCGAAVGASSLKCPICDAVRS